MALYEGGDRTRHGPYWRRQTRTTHPGERTAAELELANMQRARMGLPPLGGQAPLRQAQAAGNGAMGPLPPGLLGPFGAGASAPAGGHGAMGDLAGLELPQLLALKAMFAKATGRGRPAMRAPLQRGVLPQLQRQAVPVRAHVRIAPDRGGIRSADPYSPNRGGIRSAYPAY